jgi:hypothetical protein
MSCPQCIIIGNGPIIEEVHDRIDLLPAALVPRFSRIYSKYETEESTITADEATYVFFCATYLVQSTAT